MKLWKLVGMAAAAAVLVLSLGALVPPAWQTWQALMAKQTALVIYQADASTTYQAVTMTPGAAYTDPVWQLSVMVQNNAGSYPCQTVKKWAGGSNAFTHRVGSTWIKCESMLAENYQ